MARVHFTTAFVNEQTGVVVSSGTATVYLRDTTTLATVYADETSSTTLANPYPITAGYLDCWLVEASYDILVHSPGVSDFTLAFEGIQADTALANRGITTTKLSRTSVKTAPYTASPGDNVPVDISGGSVTITLPTAPANQSQVGVKIINISGTPGSTTLTVARGGSAVFNKAGGSTSLTLSALFQGVVLQYDTATSIWQILATDTPLGVANGAAQLDSTAHLVSAQLPTSVTGASAFFAATPSYPADAFGTVSIGSSLASSSPGAGNSLANKNTVLGAPFGGASNLGHNTTGQFNTAIGCSSMNNNDVGVANTACGASTLVNNTGGTNNSAFGQSVMVANTTGGNNTAAGMNALVSNVSGNNNTCIGQNAGQLLTTTSNTALGQNALAAATSGGGNNTALGQGSAVLLTGAQNVAVGNQALATVVNGNFNTAVGKDAGNTDGTTATTTNHNMTLLGYQAQSQTGNVIVLGSAITANRPNIVFGQAGSTGAVAGGVGVFAIANASTTPSATPTGGGVLYVSSGALRYRGSSGTDTVVAVA